MIIKNLKQYENIIDFPDHFKSEKTKTEDKGYVKRTMDFYASRAMADYNRNKNSFVKNYKLLKGEMDYDDYIHNNNKEIELFVDALEDTIELPKEIKNYPILNPPLNEMIGGLSKKKTSHRAKALDNESKNAELEHKTEVMNSLILEKARMEILLKMKQSGKLQEAQNTDDPEQVKRIKQEFQERLEEKI